MFGRQELLVTAILWEDVDLQKPGTVYSHRLRYGRVQSQQLLQHHHQQQGCYEQQDHDEQLLLKRGIPKTLFKNHVEKSQSLLPVKNF